jgi:hypothetical protein
MRIIGELDIDGIKITAFKTNERISIKFESNLLEQNYKFRDGSGIETIDDVILFCSPATLKTIKDTFSTMANIRRDAILSLLNDGKTEFDHII